MRNKLMVGIVLLATLVPVASTAQNSDKKSESGKTGVAKGTKSTKSGKAIIRGAKLFGTHCASCHAAGGNSVKPSKPVKGSQVLSTMATFKSYLDTPIGDMPHYQHLITDEKLLGDLYSYVKSIEKNDSREQSDTEKMKGSKRRV